MIRIPKEQLTSIIECLNHTSKALVEAVDVLDSINKQYPGIVQNEDLRKIITKVKNAQYHYKNIDKALKA